MLSDRGLAAWEIVSVVSSIIIAEWMVASAAGLSKSIIVIPAALAFAVMFGSHRVRKETWHDLGFRFDNFLPALGLLAVPTLIASAVCLFVAWRMDAEINFFRWHSDRYVTTQLVRGFAWGLAQQYVLQGFLNRRAMLVLGTGWRSVLAVGAIFGLLHLPNPWVTGVTLVGGVIWAAIYQRTPNLFALATSHSVMTWFIVSTLPQTVLRQLRVGFGYFS